MRALVVIPTYNEADTIKSAVRGALAADPRISVLVVDDGSPDGTGALVDGLAASEPRVRVRHRPTKAGLGSAYVEGFVWGLDEGFTALCEMDADLSHDASDLPRLLDGLAQADLIIGSRYVPGGRVVDWPARRQLLSRGGNRYVRLVTGLPLSDATSGFRAYRRELVESLDIGTVRSDGYAFQVETALRAWRLGFAIHEVPITFTERRHGASKISRAIVREAVLRVAWWGLRGPRRPATVHPRSVSGRPGHAG